MTEATPNLGSGSRETHVQVLAAEVQTLVVGSRQVTMSVYNQLDDVPPCDIDPFGRVNPSSAHFVFVYVVGRHVSTGALVSSFAPKHPENMGADGFVRFSTTQRSYYRYWSMPDARQRLEEIVPQWSALPLIVLAGLR